jgi:hypothetical protein
MERGSPRQNTGGHPKGDEWRNRQPAVFAPAGSQSVATPSHGIGESVQDKIELTVPAQPGSH